MTGEATFFYSLSQSILNLWILFCKKKILLKKRYLIVYRNSNINVDYFKSTFITIGICVSCGLFCAAAPLLGWSYYSLEGALTSCSVEWNDRSFNVVSYNVFIFCLTFLLPLLIITYCNLSIVYAVNTSLKNLKKIISKIKFTVFSRWIN